MTERQERLALALFAFMVTAAIIWLLAGHARAEELALSSKDPTKWVDPISLVPCPRGAKSCKIMVLSPEEEQALVQPNGILATAAVARKIDLEGIANYFFDKIKNAPAGKVTEPPKPVAQPAEKPVAPK